jgi:uncharacterized BrkB/YihY/UPF0761 family membrane protein
MVDWLTYGLLAVVLGFFFFLYLLVRRTILGFKEGYQKREDG